METIAIASIVGAVLFAIGVFCGKASPCHHEIYCDMYDLKLGKLGSLETKIFHLESENNRLNFTVENLQRDKRMFHEYMAAHCANCDRTFYGKSPKDQEIADLLKGMDTSKNVEELAKKLDIKIK